MRRMVVMMVAGLLTLQAGAASAQYNQVGGLEIIPMGGYRWGGSLSTVPGVNELKTKDDVSYGIGIGTMTPKNSEVEVMWSHFESFVDLQFNPGGSTLTSDRLLKRDDIVLNGYWYAYRPASSLRPFFTAGLGAAIFSMSGANGETKFTWNLGVGVRKDFNDKVAFRVAGKWMPVWVTTGSGVWCDPWYCYSVGTGENYDEFEVSGSLVINMGR